MPRFKVGDRVFRPANVYDPKQGCKFGEVVERYLYTPAYPELYTVLWDGNVEASTGYLPHGLSKVPCAGHVRQALDLTAGLFRHRQRQARLVIYPIARAIVEQLESTRVDSEVSSVQL